MRYDTLKNQAASLPDTIEIKLDRRAAILLINEKPEFWDFLQWFAFREACDLAYQNEINRRLAYQASAASLPQFVSHQPRPALQVVRQPDTITVKLDQKAASQLFNNKPECWTYSQHEKYRIAYAGAWGRELRQLAIAEEKARKAAEIAAARPAARFKRFYSSVLAA